MSPLLYLLLLLSISVLMSSCARPKGWSEADWKLAQLGISPEEHKIGLIIDELWRRNIRDILYIGMPEEEFVRRFTGTSVVRGSGQPYILTHSNHQYIISEVPNYRTYKARVTFVNGALAKYEQFGRGENPWGYSDCTFLLGKSQVILGNPEASEIGPPSNR